MEISVSEITEKAESVKECLEAHPERRRDICEDYIIKNKKRPYPCMFLNIGQNPLERRAIVVKEEKDPKKRLLNNLDSLLAPLELLNPISPYLRMGVGPGSLVASFGLKLEPEMDYAPRGNRTVDEVLKEGVPGETSGILGEVKEDIEAIRAFTPAFFKIEKPDMQGPFNLAHQIIGTEIFLLPYTEPEKYHELMALITEFYLQTDKLFTEWIGEDRKIPFAYHRCIIAECSCNLVSEEFYKEFVLPYDLKISKHYGESVIHPCSGPHVFYETARNLPNLTYTEAGKMIAPMAAGSISVADALSEIGEKPVVLSIGQELPEGREAELIRGDFDLAKYNNRLLFGYTGTHFRKHDIPKILKMHQELDEYWDKNIYR